MGNVLADSFSNVIAVALGAIPLLAGIHGFITGSFRKKAKVPYPNCYATAEQCNSNVSSLGLPFLLPLSRQPEPPGIWPSKINIT